MNKVLKLFTEIFLLLMAGLVVFLLLEKKYASCETNADLLMAKFNRTCSTSNMLLLGNSHTLPLEVTMKTSSGKEICSFTARGMDLFWSCVLLKKYIHKIPNLELILVGVDDELLGFNQAWFYQEYVNRSLYRYTDTLYHDNLMNRFLASSNFFRSNRDLTFLWRGEASHSEKETVLPLESTGGLSLENCLGRAKELSEYRFTKKLLPENIGILQSMIDLAAQHGKKIIFFTTPKSACFIEKRNHENADLAHSAMDSLFRANRIFYVDFSRTKNFRDDFFADADHLNQTGAKILLKELDSLIEIKTGKHYFSSAVSR
ncbi:MAG: hypothetical protein NT126_01010 [Bacteroidetes bacterium]|nr:hypothetical protein [Bacteroidota bacterium]